MALCRRCENWEHIIKFNNECIFQAKKEVFDDIDKFRSCGRSTDYVDMIDMSIEEYEELKIKNLV